jgi:hypothetical protein
VDAKKSPAACDSRAKSETRIKNAPHSPTSAQLQRDAVAARRPLPRAEPPKAKPSPEPEPFERGWEIISRDRLGKRGIARCLTCSSIKEISLVSDVSCGCNRSKVADQSTYARMIWTAEMLVARRRHRGAT